MGNGCLKPKPRTGQIYIDCINQIYQEVKTIQQNQLKNHQDIYSFIKDKIQKKGWLRKLMDYLTSHRSSISQAALHNFRLMAQSKGLQFKIAGLIVIDYIINAVLRQCGLDIGQKVGMMVLNMIMKQKDINAQSVYQQSQNKRQSYGKNNSLAKMNKKILQNNPSLHNIQQLSDQPQVYRALTLKNENLITSHSASSNKNQSLMNGNMNQSNSLMFCQIYNAKFSNIYYNMIHSLLSMEDGIYIYCVKSMITYSKFNNLKNLQQQKIVDILTILLEHIQTGDEVTSSLRAYQLLVQKLRDSFLEQQIKHLKIFLKIWQESFVNSNDQENQFVQSNLENRYLLENIMEKMISLTIGSMLLNRIYEQIIYVYDQRKFQNMIPFEEMLISITKKNDLKNQFYRGLYCYLLSYLAVCKGRNQKQSMRSIGSVKKIISASGIVSHRWASINTNKSYESFVSDYENIFDLKVKMSVIQTLKRWTKSYQFIQINEIIKYNSSLLLNTFLFNIHESHNNQNLTNSMVRKIPSQKKSFSHYLASQFCTNFCSDAQIQQRIALVNLLHDHIKSFDVQQSQKSIYIDMTNQLMYQEWIQGQKVLELCQTDAQYSIELNIELLSQANILINKFTQKMLHRQIDQISYFLFSIFQCMSKISVPYQQFIGLLNASIKFVQTIQRSKGSLVVLAFTQRMIKAVNNEMDKQNFFMCWDLILNCANMLLSSPRNYKRDKYKKELNQIYIKLTQNQQLKSMVHKLSTEQFDQKVQKILIDVFGQLSEAQQEENLLRITLPQSYDFQAPNSYTSNEKTYQLASIVFRDMFSRGVSIVKGFIGNIHDQQTNYPQNTHNGFSRSNSIVRQEDIGHEQKSIADVMDMINF